MTKFKILITPIIIILTGVLIALLIIFYPQITKKLAFKALSPQEAGKKVVNYFNFYLPEKEGKATLMETKEESGVYRFKLKVAQEEFEVFATKDGKFLFVGSAELDNLKRSK